MDFAIAEAINHLGRGSLVDILSRVISSYAFIALTLILIAGIVFIKDRKKGKIIVLALIIAIALHFVIGEGLLKGVLADQVYFRERPYLAHSNEITPLGRLEFDSSFPSNHMSAVVAFLSVLVFFYGKKFNWVWPSSIIFTLLMAFSRLHNGMHYPSDVIAGTGFGIFYGLVAVWAASKVKLK